jgi:hypothetical protein
VIPTWREIIESAAALCGALLLAVLIGLALRARDAAGAAWQGAERAERCQL